MKKTESERLVRSVLGMLVEKTLSRRKKRFVKVVGRLFFGCGIQHHEFDDLCIGGIDIATDELDKVVEKLRDTLGRLARGEVVLDTMSIRDIHIAGALSRGSEQSYTTLQVDQSQDLGDAVTVAILMVVHFYKVSVIECQSCRKLLVRTSPKQIFCNNACRQKAYRDHRSPGKTREIRMRKSARRRARREEN